MRISDWSSDVCSSDLLNFAIALLGRPKLLLLDEPTAGVDPQSRNFLLERVLALRDEGVTIIYSSHYLEEIERVCERALILDHGGIIAQGTLAELRDDAAMVENQRAQIGRAHV